MRVKDFVRKFRNIKDEVDLLQPNDFLNKKIFLLYKTYDENNSETNEQQKKIDKGEKLSIQNVLDLERVDKMIFKFDR